MKVLLINGFTKNSDGIRAFARFERTVKQAFRVQKCFSKEEIEFQVVDKDSIDQFLHEMNSGFFNKDSEKAGTMQLFDHLDMVFVDGDASILPWFPKARKVTLTQFLIMVRMCKRTGKVMFACSFAMQMFTYLCATNIFVSRIVNGNGKGSLVSTFNTVPKSVLSHLDYGEMFLDNATGDIYGYDQAKEEFYPIANSSIHSHKAAQEDGDPHAAKARVAMIKSFRYIPQNFDDTERVYVAQQNESSCRILKQYIQHWLSDRLGVTRTQYKEFVVPCPNGWDVHPVNTSETENIYRVFAESPRAPLIIMYKNAVCTQFHIDPKYPETVVLLENFVIRMCEKIYNEKQRLDLPLASVAFAGHGKPTMKSYQPTGNVASGHHSIAFNTAKHSGMAFSKRSGPVLVMNNATTAATIKAVHEESRDSGSSDESSYSFTLTGRRRSIIGKSEDKRRGGFASQRTMTRSDRENTIRGTATGQAVSKTDWTAVTWSQHEIREFLHPGYPLQVMRNRPRTQGGPLAMTATSKSAVRFKFTPFAYCRYKEFPQSQSDFQQTLRSEAEPFVETERHCRQQEKKSREKWVDQRDFRLVFHPRSRADVRLPLSTEPMPNVARHQFREVSREVWKV